MAPKSRETLGARRRLISKPLIVMSSKHIFSVAIPILLATASFGLARGAAMSAPAPQMSHPAPAISHSMARPGPTTTHTTSGTNWHHHRRPVFVFVDDFGWYPWWGWGYPYAYYNAAPYGGGSVVVQVQERLARAGYYHGAIDGVLGPRTHAAIRRYERAHGLHVDGEISEPLLGTMGLGR